MENMRPSYMQRIYETIKEITIVLMAVFMVRTFVFGLYQVPTGSMEKTMLVGERFVGEKCTYFFRRPHAGEVVALNDPTYPYAHNKALRLFQEYVWGPENWTKRVIAVPGDHIKGVIEDGRSVIYRNGKKLNEPYVNNFPLVYVLPDSEATLREEILKDIAESMPIHTYTKESLHRLVNHMMKEYAIPKSYDLRFTTEMQPLYRMKQTTLLKDIQGNIIYEGPYTPIPHRSMQQNKRNEKQLFNGTDEFDVQLGADDYWLMGDNRLGSTDSRFFGPIPGRLIHGKIVFRIWSVDSNASWWIVDLIRNPIDFWSRIRWNRFFQIIT
jgi:signal peptidase I